MPRIKKRKKARKVKYKKITFKLSTKELQQLDICSKIQKTTANKIVKKALREYLKNNLNKATLEQIPVSENQMDIFDIIDALE